MGRQVAILLVRELSKVLLRRRIQDVQSEPYFLAPEQYCECDGGVQLSPEGANDMIDYSRRNHLRPLGVVVLREDGHFVGYFNQDAVLSPLDRQFAKKLFHAHVHFWFREIPWLVSGQAEN